MLPVENRTIELDDFVAVYDNPEMMTDSPIRLQREAASVYEIEQEADMSGLPNPIAKLKETGVGKSPKIVDLYPFEQTNTGRSVFVQVAPVPGIRQFNIYVAADPEGRGAKVMTTIKPEEDGVDADGKESKPSPVRKTILANEFPME